jgi:DNA-directed RNA polymerase specialized sigma54-like protein
MAGMQQVAKMALQQSLSPQMQQSLHVLQAPLAELRQLVDTELRANPALEEGDETADLADTLEQTDSEAAFYEHDKVESEKNDTDDTSDSLDDIDRDSADEYADEETVSISNDDGPELDDYLMDFIEDDPATYKTRDEGGGDEDEKSISLA